MHCGPGTQLVSSDKFSDHTSSIEPNMRALFGRWQRLAQLFVAEGKQLEVCCSTSGIIMVPPYMNHVLNMCAPKGIYNIIFTQYKTSLLVFVLLYKHARFVRDRFSFAIYRGIHSSCSECFYNITMNCAISVCLSCHRQWITYCVGTLWGNSKSHSESNLQLVLLSCRVWNMVYILGVRSEIVYGKLYILVWNRVGVFRTGWHTPAQDMIFSYWYNQMFLEGPRTKEKWAMGVLFCVPAVFASDCGLQ